MACTVDDRLVVPGDGLDQVVRAVGKAIDCLRGRRSSEMSASDDMDVVHSISK